MLQNDGGVLMNYFEWMHEWKFSIPIAVYYFKIHPVLPPLVILQLDGELNRSNKN